MSTIKPTREQQDAIDAHKSGGSLKLSAYAGTGKTTTLTMIANATSRKGMYLAFNKAIVEDTKGIFPRTVECKTVHSLAFREMIKEYTADKMTSKLFPWQANKYFKIPSIGISTRLSGSMIVSEDMMASVALEVVRKYCNSEYDEIDQYALPSGGYFKEGYLAGSSRQELARVAIDLAKVMWERMIDAKDECPLGHDGYLKLYALKKRPLDKSYILTDECQDSNGVTMSILRAQQEAGAQLNYVGDKYQSIYAWRGAIDIMDGMIVDHELYLTESFRFGPEIADAASKILLHMGERKPIIGRGEPGRVAIEEPYRTVLCRTNGGVIKEVLPRLDNGESVYVAGGIVDLENEVKFAGQLKEENRAVMNSGSIMFGLKDWKTALKAIKEEDESVPVDPGLKVLVSCVEQYGKDRILASLKKTVPENSAQIIVSTVHKSKGREWNDVSLANDFPDIKKETEEDKRVLYVALTRAKKQLSVTKQIGCRVGIASKVDAPSNAQV